MIFQHLNGKTMSEIKILIPREKNRNDSMFYYGKCIATKEIDGKKYFAESAGEMQACFKENGDSYRNEKLLEEFHVRHFGDKALDKLGENDFIRMNNWLRVIEENGDDDICIVHTYDDAINVLKII
jgi:hypothetical protein